MSDYYINNKLGYDITIKNFLSSDIECGSVCIYDKNLEVYANKWLSFTNLAIEACEVNKSLETIFLIVDFLLSNSITKDITIYAIGGGTTLDIVNFAASIYKRGIPVVNVPTTLLAQVDAAIGGKCGINYGNNKNILGVIKQPKKVIIDPFFLETLDKRNYNNGMAEVIKYGCIFDENIIDILLGDYDIIDIIIRSIEAKVNFVYGDFDDNNKRQYLNFGHTYGHAIESYYDYKKYLHGEAISIGMNLKFESEKLKKVCGKFSLPTTIDQNILSLLDLKNDKKNTKNGVKFITIKKLGVVNELEN